MPGLSDYFAVPLTAPRLSISEAFSEVASDNSYEQTSRHDALDVRKVFCAKPASPLGQKEVSNPNDADCGDCQSRSPKCNYRESFELITKSLASIVLVVGGPPP